MPRYNKTTKIIFLNLPIKIQKEIDEIRRIYNPDGVKRGIAHITFKQDEDYVIENSKLIEIVEKQISNVAPFVLPLGGIKIHFDNDNFIIFVSFEKTIKLNREISKLSKKLEPFIDKESPQALLSTHWEQSEAFFPHITIATGKGVKEGKEIYEKIKQQDFNFKGKITCESLSISEWCKDHWKAIRQIYLK